MKKSIRLISLLLAVLLLLQGICAAAVEDGDDAGSSSAAEIVIPDGWAHDALVFCVEQGILRGNTNGDLLATHDATRSQLAAMLVRLFQAEPMDSLKDYSDVPEGAWYHDEMAKAVAMGLFEGSGGKLNPEKYITREQAFTVLARAFGVACEDTGVLDAFSDGKNVSLWARAGVAGLVEAGYIHGTTRGKLNPQKFITRQELAQVLYNALDCITDDPTLLTGSRCLYTGDPEALHGASIPGDLILSVHTPEDVELSGFSVEGRLVLHLHGAKRVALENVSRNIAVCCPVAVTLTEPVETIACLRDGAYAIAVADSGVMLGNSTLSGTYEEVTCLGGDPTLAADSRVEVLQLAPGMKGATLRLHGIVKKLHARARSLTIRSDGEIDTLYQYYNDTVLIGSAGTTVDCIDAGLEGITLQPNGVPEAYTDTPTVTVSGVIGNVNTRQVYGVPDGLRRCTVTYSYNGSVIKTERDVALRNGTVLSCKVTAKMTYDQKVTQNVLVTLYYDEEKCSFSLPLCAIGRSRAYFEAQKVETIRVKAKVKSSTGVYSRTSLTGKIGSISANTTVHFISYYSKDFSIAKIETEDGVRGWVRSSAIKVVDERYHNDDVKYSREVMEAFVNEVHHYASDSRYLIWCNLYTTTVNIFEGSQGNWKLISSNEVSIGKPTTPTREGEFKLNRKSYCWYFSENGRPDVTRAYYACNFDDGIAFHTRVYYTATGKFEDPALSAENSHGCVRCEDEVAKYIYTNCPLGTKVIVY